MLLIIYFLNVSKLWICNITKYFHVCFNKVMHLFINYRGRIKMVYICKFCVSQTLHCFIGNNSVFCYTKRLLSLPFHFY